MHNKPSLKRLVGLRSTLPSKQNRDTTPEQREESRQDSKLSFEDPQKEPDNLTDCKTVGDSPVEYIYQQPDSPNITKSCDFDPIFLSAVPGYSEQPLLQRAEGDRRHFRYRISGDVPSNPSDSELPEGDFPAYDQIMARSCLTALGNLIGRKVARAMIDLVGIEPEPGPKTSKSKALVVYTTMGQKHPGESSLVRVPGLKQKKKMGRKPNRQAVRSGGAINSGGMDARHYACVLSNPFDCLPVRLGGENMQPSGIATLTWRGLISVPSNGFLSTVFYPWANTPLLSSGSASSPYTYAAISGPYPGSSALASIAPNGRVIASGLRVVTTASATNNQGVLTIGCLPRSALLASGGGLTIDGFPATALATATQGFNEFFNYLQTESYPLKDGASVFWRPEDPLDFTFRDIIILGNSNASPQEDLTPFIVVGVSGAAASSQLLFEIITHIEYTVTSGTTGVVNTGMGNMGAQQIIDTAKSVFANAIDSTIPGVAGGLHKGLTAAGQKLLTSGIKGLSDYVGNKFSNSNNVMRSY
jgi:hypothetical protein